MNNYILRMQFSANSCLVALILSFVSLIWSNFIVSIPFEGADSAYEAAYNFSDSIFSFARFSLVQGYPSLPLWLFYLFSNFLGLSYLQSVHLQAFIYIYISLIFPFILYRFSFGKNLLFSLLVFYPFAVFGYFGVVLMASAFKMLFAFVFFMLFCIHSFLGKKAFSKLFIFLSLASHFSISILFIICFYREIYGFIVKRVLSAFSRIKLSFVPVIILCVVGLTFSFEVIFHKIVYNFFSGYNYESGFGARFSIVFAVFVLSLWLTGSLSPSYLPFYALILPVFLPIPLGRISWLYLYSLYFVHFLPRKYGLTVFARVLILLPVSFYYFSRSLHALASRDLMF